MLCISCKNKKICKFTADCAKFEEEVKNKNSILQKGEPFEMSISCNNYFKNSNDYVGTCIKK